jgi:hypothetical protein
MCFKKLFPSWFNPGPIPIPDPIPDPTKPRKVALLFGINDYKGTSNDFRGCLNDIDDVADMLNTKFPGFIIRKFKDSQATIETFKSECEKEIALLKEDSVVVLEFDSCFSESATRNPVRSRFLSPGLLPRTKVAKRIFRSDIANMRYLAWSGCQDDQTSADARIDGRYNGAFTYYALRSIKVGETYRQKFQRLRQYLPNGSYDQIPELEGPDYLRDKKIFEDATLLIWYSGHGSYTYDVNGDEGDGQDEVICLYDGNLLDDEINVILQKIPK